MSAERAMRNLMKIKEMSATPDEMNWLVGVLSGTVAMSSALRLLEGHRERNIAVESLDRLAEHYAAEATS